MEICIPSEYQSTWHILHLRDIHIHDILQHLRDIHILQSTRDFTSTLIFRFFKIARPSFDTVSQLSECEWRLLTCSHAITHAPGGIWRYGMHSQHTALSIGECAVIFLFKWCSHYSNTTFMFHLINFIVLLIFS